MRNGDKIRGPANPNWNGGRVRHATGYWMVRMPEHPRAHNGYVLEHLLIAERALGRVLPEGAEIHHVNGDKKDNRPQNLVICDSRAYHLLLHRRLKALDKCGHVDWLPCSECQQYGPANEMRRSGTIHLHRESCWTQYIRSRYARQNYCARARYAAQRRVEIEGIAE